MKKNLGFIFLFFITLTFHSCKKSDTNPDTTPQPVTSPTNTITINGDGINNVTETWDETLQANDQGLSVNRGLYDPTCVSPHTTITKETFANNTHCSIDVNLYGNPRTGTFTFQDLGADALLFYEDKSKQISNVYSTIDGKGTITISKMGAAGSGMIECTLSGKFINITTSAQIDVTMTKISVKRNPDVK